MSSATLDLALDHCACIVNDLAAGAARWERLGFTLTPESRQRGAVPGREGMHPWASANRCAILGRSYLELAGIVDPAAFNPWSRFLARNEGLHIFAARCDDANQTYAALSQRTRAFSPPIPRERVLDVNGEPRTMLFRNIFSRDETWPEARYIVIEHQTPEYLWQPRYQHHENGACDLVAVTFVADDPSVLVSRAEALGAKVDLQPDGVTATLPRHGVVRAMRSDAFQETYGQAAHSGMHALTVSVRDLRHTLDLLEQRGVATHESSRGHWIGPGDANGFVLHLVEDGSAAMSASVKLDHIGVAIKDLERGRQTYERLGFTLTPRSMHRGSPTPGAPVVPFGSGNHCAMFREGYLEVVGLTDPTIFSNVKSMVARYEGAHIVAFGVDSADAAHAELANRGIPIQAARTLERDAAYGPTGTETRPAAFRNMYFEPAAYPESRLLYIEHLTRDVLWQPHLLDHPNGVVGLSDVFLCVPEARAAADKYSVLFGVPACPVLDGEWRIALARGHAWIVTPEAWARRAPGAATPPPPSPVGIRFKVQSVAATRTLLTRNGVGVREGLDGSIWVDPGDACGVALYFFEKAP